MRPLGAGVLAVVLVWCVSASGGEATWDEQLLEMDYHILHLSGINAMNGLNLSRDQIIQLKALAKKVERSGARAPAMNRDLGEGFAGVRETYKELLQVLLEGKEVSPALKARVVQARDRETQTIRASIVPNPQPGPAENCGRCHVPSGANAFTASAKPFEGASFLGNRLAPGDDKSQGIAHAGIGFIGRRGVSAISQLAPQVDAVLSDGQKQIMQEFACCIIPPAELSSPVRAGQAEAPEAMLDVLRKVRSTPEATWPSGRTFTLNALKRSDVLMYPGIKAEEQAEREAKRCELLERVRKMSDAEFEMNKASLSTELRMKRPQPPTTEKGQCFKTALFLLMPGTTEIYDALLKRPECR